MFADEFLEDLRFYCAKDKCVMHGFVIMPHHVHLLLEMTGEKTVSDLIRDVKKYFSYRMRNALCHKSRFDFNIFMRGDNFQFWEQRFDEVTIVTERMFQVKLQYIHYNLVKAGLVENPEDYHYSSAKGYMIGQEMTAGLRTRRSRS